MRSSSSQSIGDPRLAVAHAGYAAGWRIAANWARRGCHSYSPPEHPLRLVAGSGASSRRTPVRGRRDKAMVCRPELSLPIQASLQPHARELVRLASAGTLGNHPPELLGHAKRVAHLIIRNDGSLDPCDVLGCKPVHSLNLRCYDLG